MTASTPQTAATFPKLRWYQYRLRSLFILTTLVAIVCSWLSVEIQSERRQGAAAKAIEKAGGRTDSRPTWLGRLTGDASLVRFEFVYLPGKSTTDDVLVHLQGQTQLTALFLTNSRITDAGLVYLQGLSQLILLSIGNTKVTDSGLAHLQGLKQLEGLALNGTEITDAGLMYLQELQLGVLYLDNTRITDAGLVYLKGLSQLISLRLENTKVTDAGLAHLQGFKQLKSSISTARK